MRKCLSMLDYNLLDKDFEKYGVPLDSYKEYDFLCNNLYKSTIIIKLMLISSILGGISFVLVLVFSSESTNKMFSAIFTFILCVIVITTVGIIVLNFCYTGKEKVQISNIQVIRVMAVNPTVEYRRAKDDNYNRMYYAVFVDRETKGYLSAGKRVDIHYDEYLDLENGKQVYYNICRYYYNGDIHHKMYSEKLLNKFIQHKYGG